MKVSTFITPAIFAGYLLLLSLTGKSQILVDFPTNHIVYQRNNANVAKIQVSGTFSAPIDRVEARFTVQDPGPGISTDWLPIQYNPQGGTFLGAVTLTAGWYRMEVRGMLANQPVGNSTIVEPIGIGEVFMIVGHSNASGGSSNSRAASESRVSTINFNNSHPDFSTYLQTASQDVLPTQFSQLCETCGISPFGEYPWYWSQLGDSLVKKLNVPVLFYSTAFGGSNLAMTYKSAYSIPFDHGFINSNLRFPFVNIQNVLEKYVPLTGLRGVLSSHGINDVDYGTDSVRFFYEKIIERTRQISQRNDLAWVVAKAAYNQNIKSWIVDAQNQVIASTSTVFPGPDLNQIGENGRTDGLHFNAFGQEMAAKLWNEVLTSDLLSQIVPIPPDVIANEVFCINPDAGNDLSFCGLPAQIQLSGLPSGGTWTALSGGNVSASGEVTGLPGSGNFSFVYSLNGCSDTVSVAIVEKPLAGNDLSFCGLPAQLQLSGLPAGGTWMALSGGSVSASGEVTGLPGSGNFSFVYSLNGCSDTVSVAIMEKPMAGNDLSFCGLPAQIQLTGLPSGGTWTALSGGNVSALGEVTGLPGSGNFSFVYSLNGCSDTVSIAILEKPVAGNDLSFCGLPAQLQLSGLPSGGTWTALSGGNVSASGEVTGLPGSGNFSFVYSFNGCSDTVSVAILEKPVAGNDLSFCGLPAQLQLSGLPSGGTWMALSGGSVSASGEVTGLPGSGNFSFVYSLNGCSDTVSVAIVEKPLAGNDLSFCGLPAQIQLTGQPSGGTWTALSGGSVSASGEVTGLPGSGNFSFVYSFNGCSDTVSVAILEKPMAGNDLSFCGLPSQLQLSGLPAGGTWMALSGGNVSASGEVTGLPGSGNFSFVYSFNGCSDTVSIAILEKPVAGNDLSFCGLPAQLQLSGLPSGGTWTALSGGNVSASGEVTGLPGSGNFSFVYSLNGCSDTVLVAILEKPMAGNDLSFCGLPAQIQLNGLPSGGTWMALSGGSVSASGEVTGLPGSGNFSFVYSLNGCSDTVSVAILEKPVAGNDLTFCGLPAQLQLSGLPAGGTWTALLGGSVSASGEVTGLPGSGNFSFVYSFNGCSDTVSVAILEKPVAGNDLTFCGLPAQLQLSGLPAGGTWTALLGGSVSASGEVTGLPGSGNFSFVYSFNGCSDTVSVAILEKPVAGNDLTFCGLPAQLQLSGLPAGGTWTALSGGSVSASGEVTGLPGSGNFSFVYSLNGCSDTVSVAILEKPVAGNDLSFCGLPAQLQLSGLPAGGTWTALSGGNVSALGEVTGLPGSGKFSFVYSFNGCSDTVLVAILEKPVAGNDLSFCGLPAQLQLSGLPSGGMWTALSGGNVSASGEVTGLPGSGNFSFVYSLNGCSDTVSVAILEKPLAGDDLSFCGLPAQLQLSGLPAGGTWMALSGGSVSASGEVTGLPGSGNFSFVYSLNGCSDTVSVAILEKPVAGNDTLLACGENGLTTTIQLVAQGINVWSNATSNPISATISENGLVNGMTLPGLYKFILSNGFCSDTVTIEVEACEGCQKPNAGEDQLLCFNATKTSLTSLPSGGVWSALDTNPQLIVPAQDGTITNLIESGVYGFVYTTKHQGETCTDTIFIIKEPRPEFTISILPSCDAGANTYHVQFRTRPELGEMIQPSFGKLREIESGLYEVTEIPNGENLLITIQLSETCSMDTLLQSPSCSCTVATPLVMSTLTMSCEGQSLPLLTVEVDEDCVARWYDSPDQGASSIGEGETYLPTKPGTYWVEAVRTVGSSSCVSEKRVALQANFRRTPCVPVAIRKLKN
ncbi:SGNH/GDSL hydrolase family protein [Arundinibacter roseus]|uniref:Ig-like domain-containing protein n=1 Tax=Arundinibacter roseus TaxID=2070510 RepID=A0A4R4KDT1_9BACT|nr:hypothetical protein [Arundinibacter roseus]TDB66080.1 hypothetical protein EZE20_10005 [Arundinibacter roseus]